tara:strand:+ start:3625 stop:5391 length:1767 start_codon:yes stop_codon:yes gene_type:complete
MTDGLKNNPLSRFARIGAASIFLFLMLLVILARLPFDVLASPLIYMLGAAALTCLAVRLLEGPKSQIMALGALAAFMAVILLWAWVTQPFYEVGQDGHSYHLAAIWSLAEGWNPFYAPPHENIWVDSYPNGYWVLESYIVSLTGLLLSGKSLNIGIMAAVALLSFGFFHDRLANPHPRVKILAALILSVIVVANPVVLTQIMTHYEDGPLYLLGVGLLFFLLSDAFTPSQLSRWAVIACIILMVNTKTAALYYVPLITMGVFIAEGLLKRPGATITGYSAGWILRKGIPYGAAFVIGIALVGYKPYVTNIVDHDAFLYPAVDEIMDTNLPENLETLSGPEKFLYGIFSRTEDSVWPVLVTAPINLKFPGSVWVSEFKDLDFDTRRGGFGPLFSLAFILAFAAYGIARLAGYGRHEMDGQRDGDVLAVTGGLLIIISAAFPEPWWARYIPFVWVGVLLLALGALFQFSKGLPAMVARGLLGIVILCFLGNIAAGFLGSLRQSLNTYQRTAMIEEMKRYPVVEISLIEDPRETSDYQSDIITSSDMVWQRLLAARGISAIITDEFIKENCAISGFFDGNILWCAKGQPKG